MVRRPKVKRQPGTGPPLSRTPLDADRCAALVVDKDQLFERRCRKARSRGNAFCPIHSERTFTGEAVTVDQLDAVAAALVPTLNRIADRG